MANPRQRAKARSHKSNKPSPSIKRRQHHKLRKAPALHGPEVLQKDWDRKKTVFQKYVPHLGLHTLKLDADFYSYASLGLLPSIPVAGSRIHPGRVRIPLEQGVKVGYGRIVRDEEGNVIDIIIPEETDGEENHEEVEEDEVVRGTTDLVRCEWCFPS